ncbi:hypothetical protein GOEFS_092_00270 [Gordonia effusa NBRC 100432]|uniref:Uncharacterized protein n=1 Tax=Gordonia effusa NBRC 100432 TaxID=1077974 RepID=H0R3F1_9ACTN|nr:nuclear transport factor 2 family protein [Gordonia effusa]GAB19602.1 hypothetical protein GOEFS_092_00270 [Gordonia effusa NBRC 100432]
MSHSTVDNYLNTWNAEPAERERHLAQHWSAAATYTDPLGAAAGRSEIAATIDAVRQQFAGLEFSPIGDADSHHNQTRFRWGLGPAGGEPLVIGFDVIVTDDVGRIATVLGFLDKVPVG